MTINQKLKRFMQTHKMTAIAEIAQVRPSTLRQYARLLDRDVPSDVAFRVARALGVAVEWLLDDTQDWPPVWENPTDAARVA